MNGHQNEAFSCLIGALNSSRKVNGYGADYAPQADWRAKPIYLNGNVYKGTYRRNNEGDYHCTEAQKHDNRLCFRNPGLLKLPVEAIYRGGNSKAQK